MQLHIWLHHYQFSLTASVVPETWASFECPKVGGTCVTGTYGDPDSCGHFYHCSSGLESTECVTVRIQCPPGYAFDWNARVCTLPELAICDGRLIHLF